MKRSRSVAGADSARSVNVGVHRAQLVVGVCLADVLPGHRCWIDVATDRVVPGSEEAHEVSFGPGGDNGPQARAGWWTRAARRTTLKVGAVARAAASDVHQVLTILGRH